MKKSHCSNGLSQQWDLACSAKVGYPTWAFWPEAKSRGAELHGARCRRRRTIPTAAGDEECGGNG
jgi:hypothetical protein